MSTLRDVGDDGHPITRWSDGRYSAAPWRWVVHPSSKLVSIQGGTPKYDLTVMDFKRWGMGSAAPRFREDVDRMNIMQRVEKWMAVVPGREHHADWFQTIDHPDARLMIAAPDMYEACVQARAALSIIEPDDETQRAINALDEAIEKAGALP